LAERTQKFAHRVLPANDQQGWDTQLGNEPGIVATYKRSWRGVATSTLSGAPLDFTPHLGAAPGNVFTYGNAGVTTRYGKRLPNDYGPPRVQPGLTGFGDFSPVSGFGWYVFAGIEGRAVARNIFLEGNTSVTAVVWTRNTWSATCSLVSSWIGPICDSATPIVLRTREY
jgi:hypothetical protein